MIPFVSYVDKGHDLKIGSFKQRPRGQQQKRRYLTGAQLVVLFKNFIKVQTMRSLMIIPEDNLEMNKGDPGKTWDLINELTSRKCGKNQNISAITIDDNPKTMYPK